MSLRTSGTTAVLLSLLASWPLLAAGPSLIMVKPWGGGEIVPEVRFEDVVVPPSHGRLQHTSGVVRYVPEDSFWALGVDSLVIEADGKTSTVTLVAGRNEQRVSDGFEPDAPAWPHHGDGARLSLTNEAALEGARGARLGPGAAPDFVQVDVFVGSEQGTGNQGTGSGMKIRLPGGAGGGAVAEEFLTFHRIQRQDAAAPAVQLGVRRLGATTYALRLEATGQQAATVELPAGTHRLALNWREPESPNLVQARLRVDDVVVAEPGNGPGVQAEVPGVGTVEHAFGGLGPGSQRWLLDLDDLTVDTGELVPGAELVLASDFENDASPWDRAGSSVPLLSEQGALSGKGGVLLDLGHAEQGLWIAKDPEAETAFGLRLGLLVSPGLGVPSEGLTFVAGSSSDNLLAENDVFALALVKREGGLHLEARTWADGTPLSRSVALEAGRAHVVELQWYAPGPAGDGLLRLWLDGVRVGKIAQIHGAPRLLESLRLGILDPGPSDGKVAVDDVVLWRPLRLPVAPQPSS